MSSDKFACKKNKKFTSKRLTKIYTPKSNKRITVREYSLIRDSWPLLGLHCEFWRQLTGDNLLFIFFTKKSLENICFQILSLSELYVASVSPSILYRTKSGSDNIPIEAWHPTSTFKETQCNNNQFWLLSWEFFNKKQHKKWRRKLVTKALDKMLKGQLCIFLYTL